MHKKIISVFITYAQALDVGKDPQCFNLADINQNFSVVLLQIIPIYQILYLRLCFVRIQKYVSTMTETCHFVVGGSECSPLYM